jgi:hypothetical protein
VATFTPVQLGQAQLTTSYSTVYGPVPGATTVIVKEIIVCNTTGSAVVLDISYVPSGGTAGVANNILSQEQIGAYSTVAFSFSSVLPTGATIQARASAGSALTVTASGVTVV